MTAQKVASHNIKYVIFTVLNKRECLEHKGKFQQYNMVINDSAVDFMLKVAHNIVGKKH